jgi:hydrogenase maturation protein HypF
LLGLGQSVSYEGQAASALEMMASQDTEGVYGFKIEKEGEKDLVRLRPFIAEILTDIESKIAPATIAGKFHNTLVKIGVEVCRKIRQQEGLTKVALSGGVFQNRLLSERMKGSLEKEGFTVFVHRQVPCNDGGLSLGQAVVANFV